MSTIIDSLPGCVQSGIESGGYCMSPELDPKYARRTHFHILMIVIILILIGRTCSIEQDIKKAQQEIIDIKNYLR